MGPQSWEAPPPDQAGSLATMGGSSSLEVGRSCWCPQEVGASHLNLWEVGGNPHHMREVEGAAAVLGSQGEGLRGQ